MESSERDHNPLKKTKLFQFGVLSLMSLKNRNVNFNNAFQTLQISGASDGYESKKHASV